MKRLLAAAGCLAVVAVLGGAAPAAAFPFGPGSSAVLPDAQFYIQGSRIDDPTVAVEVASDAPTFYGYTVPSARVVLTDGERPLAYEVVSDARGYWLTHPLEPFSAGTHRLYMTLEDASGVRAGPDLVASFVVDEPFVGTRAGTAPARDRGYGAPPPPRPSMVELNFFTGTLLVSAFWALLLLVYLSLRAVVVGEDAGAIALPAPIRRPVARLVSARTEFATVVGGYLLLTLVLTWPLAKHLGTHVPDHGDPLFTSWIMAWGADTFPSASVFHAPMFTPQPWTLALSENLLGLSVPLAGLWHLTHDPILLNNVGLMISFTLNGALAYALARELGAVRVGAAVAGAVFAFAPYRLAQLSHLHVEATFWIPLMLLLVVRFARRPSWQLAVGVGATFVAQTWTSLNGGVVAALALAVTVPIVLWCVGAERRRRAVAMLGGAVIVVAVGLVPLVVPFARARDTASTTVARADVAEHAADASAFVTVPSRHVLLARPTEHLREGPWPEKALYPGIVAVGLAVAGAWRIRRRRALLVAASTLIVVSVVLALGPGTSGIGLPFEWLRRLVPGFDNLRVPTLFWPLALLSLGVLASRAFPAARRSTIVLLGVLLIEFAAPPALRPAPDVPPVYAWLSEREGVVMELPALEVADIGGSIERETTALYRQTFHGAPLANGYSAVVPASYAELLEASASFPSRRARRALLSRGVRWLVIDTAELPETPWWGIDVRVDEGDIVYRDRDVIVVEVRS